MSDSKTTYGSLHDGSVGRTWCALCGKLVEETTLVGFTMSHGLGRCVDINWAKKP